MRVLTLLILSEVLLLHITCTSSSSARVRRQNMKVRITATGDTIVLKFLRAEADTKLEGYILGYGSGMFSKQFIKLPEDSEHYETEIDAEPKYLIAVWPAKANEVKQKCTGKVSLEKPLHLMIGTVTPTSVLLSWGTLLKTPYTDAHLDDCMEDGEFTVRYKEKETSNKWNYETCPTTDTVIDHLKPDTPYEFEVRAENDTDTGLWSPPVTHNTADKNIEEPLKPKIPQKPIMEGPQVLFPPVAILHNNTQSRQPPRLRHTGPSPVPRRNQGTGSDGIASSSPTEDPLLLTQTQTLISSQTLMRQPTSKTTNPFHPQPSTSYPPSSRTLEQFHKIQFQLSTIEAQSNTPDTQPITKTQSITTETQPITTQTQPITTKIHPSITETHISTDKAHLRSTDPRTVEFHSTGQLQFNTIQTKFTTTQSQTSTTLHHSTTIQPKPITERFHFRTTHSKPITTSQKLSSNQYTTVQQRPRKGQNIFTRAPDPITTHLEPFITHPQNITTQPKHITIRPKHIPTQPKHITIRPKHITTQPKHITIRPKHITTQPKHITIRPKHITTQPKHITIRPKHITTQPKHITIRPKHITTQKKPIIAQPEAMKTKSLPSTTQQNPSTPQLRATQPKSITTQAKPRILQKTSTTTQQMFGTSPPSTIAQQQIPTQPNNEQVSLTLPQPWTVKKEPSKMGRPSSSTTTQYQTYTVMPKSVHEYNSYYQLSTTSQHKQVRNANASPAASTKNFFTSVPLTLASPKTDIQESIVSQHPVSQQTPYDSKETPIPIKTVDWYSTSTREIVAKTREQPLGSPKFQKEPVVAQNYHPHSSTIQIPHTTQWQYGKKDSTPKSKPQITNRIQSGTKHVPEHSPPKIQTNLIKKPLISKSNVNHWPETQAVNQKLSVNQEAPSQSQDGEPLPKPALVSEVVDRDQGEVISRNSSHPDLLARPLGNNVAQNGTHPAKRVSHNSSSPGPVRRPMRPRVDLPPVSAAVWNGTRPAKRVSHNSSSPGPVGRPMRPRVDLPPVSAAVWNATRPAKRVSHNTSSPGPVGRPMRPRVDLPPVSAAVWNATRPAKRVSHNTSSPGPVGRPMRPRVDLPPVSAAVWNGTRPAKRVSHNSSSPGPVGRPMRPRVDLPPVSAAVWNATRPVKRVSDNTSSPGPVGRPMRPRVDLPPVSAAVWNGTPPGHGTPGSIRNTKTLPSGKVTSGVKHQGLSQPKPTNRPKKHFGSSVNQRVPDSKKKTPNQVEKSTGKGKIPDLKQVDRLPVLKPQAAPSTEKTIYQKPTAMSHFAFNGSQFDTRSNFSVFSSVPVSDLDALGKKRFVAPHVLYKTDKRPEEPCSVTHSLSFFPNEENEEINVTGPPKIPPSNLTVVTVEGCPSFVILDWEKTDNETTEYEVSTKGPNGKEIGVVTTNQTHTAVENLKPQSNYKFTVTPKNELGAGPATEPITFSTESADPRVSDAPTGKTAIWSTFPFKADSYTECNGRQYVKRTWYRKFVGIQLCNSLRYKIYLSDTLRGRFYTIGDQTGYGEDHCQFVDSFLDGRTGGPLSPNQLPSRQGYFRSERQEPVKFGNIGGNSHINYVAWYECGVPIPGSW